MQIVTTFISMVQSQTSNSTSNVSPISDAYLAERREWPLGVGMDMPVAVRSGVKPDRGRHRPRSADIRQARRPREDSAPTPNNSQISYVELSVEKTGNNSHGRTWRNSSGVARYLGTY